MRRFVIAGLGWLDDSRNILDVGVGVPVPGPWSEWSIDVGLWHLLFQSPEILPCAIAGPRAALIVISSIVGRRHFCSIEWP